MRHATARGRSCRPLIWWAIAGASVLFMLVGVPGLAGLPAKPARAAGPAAAQVTGPGISAGPGATVRARAGLVRHAEGRRYDNSVCQFRASGATAGSVPGGSVGGGCSDAASVPPSGRVQLRDAHPTGSPHLGNDPPSLAGRALPPAAPRPPPSPAGRL